MAEKLRTIFDMPAGRAQPALWRFVLASLVAIGGSLAVCRLVVVAAVAVFPATAGYAHFQFTDYAKLTVIGVTLAALSWPAMTFVSSRARLPFLVLTVLVVLASLAPDAWILYKGQPVAGVGALAVMHLALALVTYPALVFIAPQRRPRAAPAVARAAA